MQQALCSLHVPLLLTSRRASCGANSLCHSLDHTVQQHIHLQRLSCRRAVVRGRLARNAAGVSASARMDVQQRSQQATPDRHIATTRQRSLRRQALITGTHRLRLSTGQGFFSRTRQCFPILSGAAGRRRAPPQADGHPARPPRATQSYESLQPKHCTRSRIVEL